MVSSLAAQLSKGVSLNASLLADRSQRKHAESYLFTSREADKHDFYSIRALGLNGLAKLKSLNSKFAKYENTLFSDASANTDRTLQSEAQNVELDQVLAAFLGDLGPYLLEAPTSQALEWIVRRFRVNEFNLNDVMVLFLPYHESPHFAKMVSILHVKDTPLWSLLSPLKASGKALPRSLLVEEMLTNVDLARFVADLLPDSLASHRAHRTLIGFTASVTVDYLTRMKKIQEETVAFILPAAIRTFAPDSDADSTMAGYTILATLSQHCRLAPEALEAIIIEMIKGQKHTPPQQILPFLVAVLEPQELLQDFSDSVADSILGLSDVVAVLPECLHWVGSDKLVLPLLPSLVRRVNQLPYSELLKSLLFSPSIAATVVERCIVLLLGTIHSAGEPDSTGFQILCMAHQRHGTIFSEVTEKLLKGKEESGRQKLESILRSVILPSSMSAKDSHGKWILASTTADVGSRVLAVRELLKTLAAGGLDAEHSEELNNALRARVQDTNPTVIETLYSDPKVILPVVSDFSFIESVSKALAMLDVTRSITRLHFSFVAGEVSRHNAALIPAIFEHVYLPYILFTKPRQKTAALVWQCLRGSPLADYELLVGCMDIVFAESTTEGVSRSMEEMGTLNLKVISQVAGNIIASNAYPRHFDMLLNLLNSSDAHTTIVSYLLLRVLLDKLSGEHRVDAAYRILTSMNIQSMDTLRDAVGSMTNIQDMISDDTLSRSVVLKPSSIGTKHRLQVAVLALLPIVQPPVDLKIDWLGDSPLESSDTRGKHFVQLARAIYSLANSAPSAQVLSTSILRALFVTLRERTLLFLAGIWSAPGTDMGLTNLPFIALSHGAAFLKAQTADATHVQDFQVILPSLLIALQSRQHSVRSAAMDCVSIISENLSRNTVSPTIYALDSVYGTHSDGLQYLEWSDFGQYISSIYGRREHFINDEDYIGVFQQEMLRKEQVDSKKEAGYKHRIMCYLLSHVNVWVSLEARVALLGTLKNVRHRAKLQMLLPLIQEMLAAEADRSLRELELTYLELLIEAFDKTATPDLNETGSGSWILFLRLLRSAFSTGAPLYSSLRQSLLQQLCDSLFNSLTLDHQREACIILIESAAVITDHHQAIKEALGVLLKDTSLIASLFLHFSPVGTDSPHRASKRAKLAIEPSTGTAESSLRSMTILIETLVAHPPPASVELLSCAVDALTRVSHTQPSQSDANYLMQLLMSMMESITSSLPSTVALLPGSIRMEILVELLRVADNPQTFNQVLLLIGSLARLSPEFVMQNVMPVFTFMGSNVFHRDDAYSFRVVQKTVESIVPVMIASFKAKHTSSLDLQIASREFLRVFTGAATHVPRHRRTQFFNHLVEVLGPDEFTVPVCLLLVDKAAHRVVRQKSEEVANTLNLPLAIVQTYYKATPFKIVEQLLQEAARLVSKITDPNGPEHGAFLESPQNAEETPFISTKRQIQAIIIFVDLILQQSSRKNATSDGHAIQESVRLLLALANLERDSATFPQYPELSRVAIKTIGHLLRAISAAEFVSVVSTILMSNHTAVETGAMNLLALRLAAVTPKTRLEVLPVITSITEHACGRLETSEDPAILRANLKAISTIARTATDKEAPILTKAVPLVLHVAIRYPDITSDVLESIVPLSAKIGPRVLPFLKDIVRFCSNVLLQSQKKPEDDSHRTEEDAQTVLVALLSSLSQFWGIDELTRLIELSLGTPLPLLTLRKTLVKRIRAKQLLPAMFNVWASFTAVETSQESWQRRTTFFDLFKGVIRRAPREDVHEYLRQTFNMLLDAFNMIGTYNTESEAFETVSLAAFVEVVTKLNEAAFKPWFRRLFDWAFNDTTGEPSNRQIIFSHALKALIALLKGLITPYMGMTLGPLIEVLESYRSNKTQNLKLWLSVIELLQTSLALDEGAFWRPDKLRKLMPTLIAQAAVCTSFNTSEGRPALKTCLSTLVESIEDDSLLKSLNLELLLQTRSEDAQVRLFALECAGHLWDANWDKLMGFISDNTQFIEECADDEHDEVAKEARRFKKTIEKHAA